MSFRAVLRRFGEISQDLLLRSTIELRRVRPSHDAMIDARMRPRADADPHSLESPQAGVTKLEFLSDSAR
jgi:hypothetical protein